MTEIAQRPAPVGAAGNRLFLAAAALACALAVALAVVLRQPGLKPLLSSS